MKKHLILFLAFSIFLASACEEESALPYDKLNESEGYPALIHFIRPLSARVSEEVSIIGEHFEQSFQKYEVHFKDHFAEIIYEDGNTIKVRVPENLLPGEYTISLYVNGRKIVSEEVFQVIDSGL